MRWLFRQRIGGPRAYVETMRAVCGDFNLEALAADMSSQRCVVAEWSSFSRVLCCASVSSQAKLRGRPL